jgi:hypothetical protein
MKSELCREIPREIIVAGWKSPRLGDLWIEQTTHAAYDHFSMQFGVEGLSGRTLAQLARGKSSE